MKKFANTFGVIGAALILVAFIYNTITGISPLVTQIGLYLGILLLLLFVIFKLSDIQQFFSKRSAKYGTNAVVSALIVLVILFFVNVFAVKYNLREDYTAANQYSLSPQSKKVLNSLQNNIQVTAFFKSDNQQAIHDLLTEYSYYSDKFKYKILDPDRHPDLARDRYNISAYGTTVVDYNGKQEKITSTSEEDLTNAIIKVTRESQKIIYFVNGHGERDIEVNIAGDKGGDGLAIAKNALEEQNFIVKSILLVREQKVPDDCSVLVIPGPETKLLQNEITMIRDYLQHGGKVLLMVDPAPRWDGAQIMENWGVIPQNDVVLDVSGVGQLFGAGPAIPIASKYGDHAITKDFSNIITAFPYARSLKIEENTDSGITSTKLIETSANSWGETNISKKPVEYTEGEDIQGPLTLNVVLERSAAKDTSTENADTTRQKSRLLVCGDSDFATNSWFNFQRNGDLFLNMVTWLAEEEDLVSIRAREPEDRRISLTQAQSRIILIFGVILFPVMILSAGVVVYFKRR